MKKIIFSMFLFILMSPTIYANAGICDSNRNIENCKVYLLENQKVLESQLQELQKNQINNKINEIISNLKGLEKEMLVIEEDTIQYLEKEIQFLNLKKELIENTISLSKLTSNQTGGISITELENIKIELSKKNDLLNVMIFDEEQKIIKNQQYYKQANISFNVNNYENSIENFRGACEIEETFNCLLGLLKSYYFQAENYKSNIAAYGNQKLYDIAVQEGFINGEKLLKLSLTDSQKLEVDEFINKIKLLQENKNNQENTTTQTILNNPQNSITDIKQDKINLKVDEIWKRIEKLTSSYSEEKKQATYKLLITKLEEYIKKSQDDDLKQILSEIILRLKGSTAQEENIGVYDRTEEFYKKSLQEYTYSCEISATADILSTLKNKNFTEDELIEKIDKSKFGDTAKYSNGIYIWGNPNAGFVGYIDVDEKGNIASQRNLTGYGVYEAPIVKLYNDYGVKTEIINNSHYTTQFGPEQHLQKLLEHFAKGNYVQLWGDICTSPEYDDGELALADITQADVDNGKNAKNECWSFGQDRKRVWYYENGTNLTKHQGLIGEHNFYLLGYEGTPEKPTNIIIWDTSTGKHTYPIKEWMRKWEEMDYRSIIVYAKN